MRGQSYKRSSFGGSMRFLDAFGFDEGGCSFCLPSLLLISGRQQLISFWSVRIDIESGVEFIYRDVRAIHFQMNPRRLYRRVGTERIQLEDTGIIIERIVPS